MSSTSTQIDISCAVEVFIAIALLHKEQPGRSDFTIQEIVSRAAKENLAGEIRSGVNVHASQHCVGNKAPNPSKLRMIYATGKHTRRLIQSGDDVHPGRTGKIFPDEHQIPQEFLPLLAWAKSRYETTKANNRFESTFDIPTPMKPLNSEPEAEWLGSLLRLRGLGKELYQGIDPDQYVRELREGWE